MRPDIDPNVDLEWKTTDEAGEELDALVDRAGETEARIVLTRNGKTVDALVHVDDAIDMQALDDRDDRLAAKEALADTEKHSAIPWEVVRAELERRGPPRLGDPGRTPPGHRLRSIVGHPS